MPHPAKKGKTFQPLIHPDDTPMPGPKMGPRPADFDEKLVRQAPTFKRWLKLNPGEKIRYACREFTKGFGDDEERLMRRLMIARRNNLKDHEALKQARAVNAVINPATKSEDGGTKSRKRKKSSAPLKEAEEQAMPTIPDIPTNPSGTTKRRLAGLLQPSDEEILMEMDIPAVEATRSYRKWLTLSEGEILTYNQSYIKGKLGDDWLLKKNIWRRMRYRRENRKMVAELKSESEAQWPQWKTNKEEEIKEENPLVSQAVVEAAAAAAESYVHEPAIDADAVAALGAEAVSDPLMEQVLECDNDDGDVAGIVETAVASALDAAAMLAASVVPHSLGESDGVDTDAARIVEL